MRYEINVQTGSVTEHDDAPIVVLSKAKRINARTALFDADVATLTNRWVAAGFADGETEAIKKATITADYSALLTQYTADIAAIKAS